VEFFVQILDYANHQTIVVRQVAVGFETLKKAVEIAEGMYNGIDQAGHPLVPYGVRVVDGAKETLWERKLSDDYLGLRI